MFHTISGIAQRFNRSRLFNYSNISDDLDEVEKGLSSKFKASVDQNSDADTLTAFIVTHIGLLLDDGCFFKFTISIYVRRVYNITIQEHCDKLDIITVSVGAIMVIRLLK